MITSSQANSMVQNITVHGLFISPPYNYMHSAILYENDVTHIYAHSENDGELFTPCCNVNNPDENSVIVIIQ